MRYKCLTSVLLMICALSCIHSGKARFYVIIDTGRASGFTATRPNLPAIYPFAGLLPIGTGPTCNYE